MKKSLQYCLTLFTLLLVAIACTTNDDSVLIQGNVYDAQSGDALENATVQVTAPGEFSDLFGRTDENGNYSIGDIEVEEVTDLSITASAAEYVIEERDVTVAPGDNITGFDFELLAEDAGGGNDGGGDEGVGGEAAGAAAIILSSLAESSINIAETGGIVNSAFSFQVQDSAGRAINANNAVDVQFNIVSGPGNETITPEVVRTNPSGIATSNLFSGNTAGVVKIEAVVIREDIGLTIRSKPVAITIHGGFPDPDHFSLSISTLNFEGFARDGVRNQISVVVGDKFSNPVKPGTAVYFNSTGGVIQGSQNNHTNNDGLVSVELISGGERSLLNHPTLGFGYATITAFTVDENDVEISKDIDVLFSGPPSAANIIFNPTTVNIPANGGQSFTLTVTDINNNPLPAGTTVTIETAEGLEVTGGDIEIPNALLPGPGVTQFAFSVADTDDENSNVQDTQITVKVETPFGDKASNFISGTRAKTRGF